MKKKKRSTFYSLVEVQIILVNCISLNFMCPELLVQLQFCGFERGSEMHELLQSLPPKKSSLYLVDRLSLSSFSMNRFRDADSRCCNSESPSRPR
jgi:hypothetical protein